MRIHKVTITGADDSTSIPWLLTRSRQYPFVEWGILVSKSQVGSYRFPTIRWIDEFVGNVKANPELKMQNCMHLCGKYVRDICKGDWTSFLTDLEPAIPAFQRIQLNFHADKHKWADGATEQLATYVKAFNLQVIFQADDVNNELCAEARQAGVDAVTLFDTSGGAGIVPDEWPEAPKAFCGYAGGLGPNTLMMQLSFIQQQAQNADIWIDMERNVRSQDDSILDPDKVETVLRLMSNSGYIAQTA